MLVDTGAAAKPMVAGGGVAMPKRKGELAAYDGGGGRGGRGGQNAARSQMVTQRPCNVDNRKSQVTQWTDSHRSGLVW